MKINIKIDTCSCSPNDIGWSEVRTKRGYNEESVLIRLGRLDIVDRSKLARKEHDVKFYNSNNLFYWIIIGRIKLRYWRKVK